ncbi:hypothetical protein B0H13DRAFT_1876848 [Mycena leptocephala]|nr:hypothetical protein B0H13DRAFT_1876848 [Mycena leptocephala]
MELNRGIQTCQLIGWGPIPFTHRIRNLLPRPCDHRLEAYYTLKTLVFEALEHFEHFNDLDLKCQLYNVLTTYYQRNLDISTAKDFCESSISLALSTRNTKMQSLALINLAWINWSYGDYFTAQVHAKEGQRLARISGDLYREAQALNFASQCCQPLGNYKQSISLCSRARDLTALCGMSSGYLDHRIMTTQAEIHKDFYSYGFALLNVAQIDVAIGSPMEDVQCAYLYLREGNFLAAMTLFESCLKLSFTPPDIMSYSLERLGNALQFLGDTFLAQDDEHTAINLFTVALEGFTYMDVHCSRAECMLRLGDISKGEGDLLNAVELWTTARSLFEQSSQAKQVENIDQRLAGVSEDVLEQHRKNLDRLTELTAPSGTVDEINELSDIEDMEGLDLEDETTLDPVALVHPNSKTLGMYEDLISMVKFKLNKMKCH